MRYIILHDAGTGNEIKIFLDNVFAIQENMVIGTNPENLIFVKETPEEINNILLLNVFRI